jgi:hypothetical protein
LNTDKDFENIITGNQKYSLSGSVTKIITEFMMAAVVPWFRSCLTKYSQQQFHNAMKNGFTFIGDWKTNHPEKYAEFLSKAKKIKFFLKIDEYDILRRVEIIMSKEGWVLYENEKAMILEDIRRLKMDIYGHR